MAFNTSIKYFLNSLSSKTCNYSCDIDSKSTEQPVGAKQKSEI